MQHAFKSFNTCLIAIWDNIAPGVPVVIDSINSAAALPADCLRVFWESDGDPTDVGCKNRAVLDLAIRVPPVANKPNGALAIARRVALDLELGFRVMEGYGRFRRYDWTTTPPTYLNLMEVAPDGGWVPGDTESPGQIHISRMVHLTYWLR